jgi:hypothetical protein
MSQLWDDNTYQKDHVGSEDLQQIENNFAALKSNFSGAAGPAEPTGGQRFFNTSSNNMKVRASDNLSWNTVMHGDEDSLMWFHTNTAQPGWVIDSSVTDAVVALKGGTEAYNRTGGGTAGSWVLSNITQAHNHQWTNYSTPGVLGTETTFDVDGNSASLNYNKELKSGCIVTRVESGQGQHIPYSKYTKDSTTTATGDGTWRAAAAIGTLQYPDE